jgi:hypothetical protein
VQIQALFRGTLGRAAFAGARWRAAMAAEDARLRAAVVLQRFARGNAGRAVAAANHPLVLAAVRIQTAGRGWLARRRVEGMRVTRITAMWRSRHAVWERRARAAAAVEAEAARYADEAAAVKARGEAAKDAALAFLETKRGNAQLKLELRVVKLRLKAARAARKLMTAMQRKVDEARQVFELFDTDGSNTIEVRARACA